MAVEAEREALTLESVVILPPDEPQEVSADHQLEPGLEKTEATMISEPGGLDGPGLPGDEHGAPGIDSVVIGDAESVHPLSPS